MLYEDLFDELEQQLKATCKNMKKLDSKLNVTKRQLNIPSKTDNLPKTYKHVEKQAPAYVFPKSQRFHAKNEDNFDETQLSFASFSTNPSLDSVRLKGPAVVFGKSQRFEKEKTDLEEDAEFLNPNYEITKKKVPTLVVYKTTKPLKPSSKISEEIEENLMEPGPGEYSPKYGIIEKRTQTGGVFPRSLRFVEPEKDEQQEINPNYHAIKPKVRAAVIKKETEKNEKLLQKQRFDQFLQVVSAKYRVLKPVENDKAIRNHVPTAFIAAPVESKTDKKADMIRFFYMVDKINELRQRGPGQYTIERKLQGPCMVVYRSCSPIVLDPLKNKRPAPNQYDVKDDLIKASQPKYTFKKSPKHKKLKLNDLDWRTALDPDHDAIRKRVPNAVIMPEKRHRNPRRALSDINANRLGPGRYNLIFDLVETRNDKGVLPYKLTPFNERAVQMDPVPKDLFDADLDPNYDFTKPRKPEFHYYEPTIWNPPHPSDGMLFKERWRFYDYDVNKVRPEIKPIDFAKNLNMKEFLQFEYEFKLLEDYLQRRNKIPEIGHYNADFTQVDKKVQGFDMEKMKDRAEKDPYVNKDELILNPEKPKPKVPVIDFEKQKGRDSKEPPQQDELLLQPNYNQIDKKVPGFVDFDKHLDRKEKEEDVNNPNNPLILEPKYEYTEAKIKGNADFGKIVSRDDHPINKINVREEECIITPKEDLVRPFVGNFVQMDKGGERFKPNTKESENGLEINMKTDVIQAYEASKPEKNAMKFQGYAARENPKKKPPAKKKETVIKGKNKK